VISFANPHESLDDRVLSGAFGGLHWNSKLNDFHSRNHANALALMAVD